MKLNVSIKPIFGYGNLSCSEDALGVLILEHIEVHFSLKNIYLLTDFQLQIEHAVDLENRELVVFLSMRLWEAKLGLTLRNCNQFEI